MTHSGTTDACLCLSEAYHDAGFNDWAVAHGIGFDFYKAVKDSSWGYWTAQGDAFTFDLGLAYQDVPLFFPLSLLETPSWIVAHSSSMRALQAC